MVEASVSELPYPRFNVSRQFQSCSVLCIELGIDFSKFQRFFTICLSLRDEAALERALLWYKQCFFYLADGHRWLPSVLSWLSSALSNGSRYTCDDIRSFAYESYSAIKDRKVYPHESHYQYSMVHLWRFVQIAQGADPNQHEFCDV